MLSRPKLGVCTWTFGDLPFTEIAGRIAAMGFDGVELLGGLDRYQRENLSAADVNRILADHGLTVFAMTPPNVDLAHPDTAVSQPAFDSYRRLLDFAAAMGEPLVVVRGFVGRVSPVAALAEEMEALATAVHRLAEHAQIQGLRLVIEAVNRYESHLINTGAAALTFVERVGMGNVGVLLDAFHMNIEEQYAAGAIRHVDGRLWLYHMADSNRQAIGRGHIKFGDHLWALEDIGYQGPIIFEFTAPGPNPFVPIKDENALEKLETYLRESVSWF